MNEERRKFLQYLKGVAIGAIGTIGAVSLIDIFRNEDGFKGGIQGVIYGSGDSALELKLIPKEKDVREGDSLITTITGDVFPEGLRIGAR